MCSTQPINSNPLIEALKILSIREVEIMDAVANHKSNRQIAEELYLSVRTIENTRYRICKKLGLKKRGALKQWIAMYYK